VGAIWEASKLGGLNIKKCLQSRKLAHEKSRSWNEAGSQPVLSRGKADDIGEVNRDVHPMGPPWQGTRQPRKDTQNNVEKVQLAAGAGSNLHRLLERGYGRRRGELARGGRTPSGMNGTDA
jgi:hypothetical protein